MEHDRDVMERKSTHIFEEYFPVDGSETIIFETTKTPVQNKSGKVCGIVGVVRDVTEQRTLEDHLRYLSYTDTLSGLYNRTFFNETLSSLCKEDVFPLGFILADVNGLKIINDTLGHLVGDELIQSTAQLLKDTCPKNARIFRWGGDEFVILLPNSTQEDCNKLILQITNVAERYTNEDFRLSLSLGSSLIYDHNVNINKIMQDAEEKLYRKKMLHFKSLRNSVLSTLQKSLAAKNVETEAHTQRLVDNCLAIGRAMQLDLAVLDELVLVAKLHDIGKIGIPESILLKPSRLTEEEFELMKTHTEKGYRLTCSFPELSHISRAILTHHERWDGKGYPLGLKGEEIPLVARIVAIVDAYDAMTHNRNYNHVKTKEQALAEIKRCAGSQFDPEIVNVFCQL